jgi:hypothetical protein
MPALGESRESNKGFGFLKADGNQGQLEGNRAVRGHQLQCHFQFVPNWAQVAAGLLAAASAVISFTISARTQVNSFERNAAAPRQLSPFLRTGSHQQPSSTGNLWNILEHEPASRAVKSARICCVFRLSTMSSLVQPRIPTTSCRDSAKWHSQPTLLEGMGKTKMSDDFRRSRQR